MTEDTPNKQSDRSKRDLQGALNQFEPLCGQRAKVFELGGSAARGTETLVCNVMRTPASALSLNGRATVAAVFDAACFVLER
jgi:hypothetical protein